MSEIKTCLTCLHGGFTSCLQSQVGLCNARNLNCWISAEEVPKYKQHAYDYMYKGIRIDPYRIFVEYEITHPAQQHSIKKLLRAGRSVKTLKEDIEESIKTLERWLEMIEENEKQVLWKNIP